MNLILIFVGIHFLFVFMLLRHVTAAYGGMLLGDFRSHFDVVSCADIAFNV